VAITLGIGTFGGGEAAALLPLYLSNRRPLTYKKGFFGIQRRGISGEMSDVDLHSCQGTANRCSVCEVIGMIPKG
jgi:hypothetical protein